MYRRTRRRDTSLGDTCGKHGVSGLRFQRLATTGALYEETGDVEILTVHRWTDEAYLMVLAAERGERIRAEPFEALAWDIGVLFGDDPEDEALT